MKTLQKIGGWFSSPWWVFVWPFVKMARGIVPDELYVKMLKFYIRCPEYMRMVDKVARS